MKSEDCLHWVQVLALQSAHPSNEANPDSPQSLYHCAPETEPENSQDVRKEKMSNISDPQISPVAEATGCYRGNLIYNFQIE